MMKTEMRNPKTTHIDRMSTLEMVSVINEENANVITAVEAALPDIAKAIDAAAAGIARGGRLIYLGCGTSGRLGVLDASECPPTFGVPASTVVGIIAGGDRCLRAAAENAEDSAENGVKDLAALEPGENDVVVGISVAGEAAYVLRALDYAREKGSVTVGITSNANSSLANNYDISICTDTGAEVITGSTRMKAGTAHKLVLNMLSTCAMIKQGHVYENLMINLRPTNIKLRARTIRIVSEITGLSLDASEKLLEENDWVIKKAVAANKANGITVREETFDDYEAITKIHTDAFRSTKEADMIAASRKLEGFSDAISLVAEKDGKIVGHILFSPVTVETPADSKKAYLLAPLAVAESARSGGIGSLLVTRGIEMLKARGCELVLVSGGEYYDKFGFSMSDRIFRPNPVKGKVIRALYLSKDAKNVTGVIKYPASFADLVNEWSAEK